MQGRQGYPCPRVYCYAINIKLCLALTAPLGASEVYLVRPVTLLGNYIIPISGGNT